MSEKLKLLAESEEGVVVISAALQDAIIRIGSVKFDKNKQIFHLLVSRFCHEEEQAKRCQSALAIYNVLQVKSRGIDKSDPDAFAVLLAINYEKSSPAPACKIKLLFAGGGEILLDCDMVELRLIDLQSERATDKIPVHPDEVG